MWFRGVQCKVVDCRIASDILAADITATSIGDSRKADVVDSEIPGVGGRLQGRKEENGNHLVGIHRGVGARR